MKFITLSLSLLVVSLSVKAETTKKTTQTTTTTTTTEVLAEPSTMDRIQKQMNDSVQKADQTLSKSATLRSTKDYGVFLIYSPMDLIIPSKIGGSIYFTGEDKSSQYEFQFLNSTLSAGAYSVDLASMTEQKFSLLKRNFSQDSNFNFFYGLSYATLEARLGSDYLSTVPINERPNADMMKIHVLALDLGIGNRWYFDNGLILGVDWVGITQPVTSLKKEQHFTDYSSDQNDKDKVDQFLGLATFFPRIYTLKLQLGYSF